MRSDLNMCVISLNNTMADPSLEPFPVEKSIGECDFVRELCVEWGLGHLLDRISCPISFRCRSFSVVSLCPVANP